MDFREYEALIKEKVAQKNEKDTNWKWSVKSIGKTKVSIRWGYLDYLEEKKNCFILEVDNDCGEWIYAMTPHREMIECYMVSENPNPNIGAEMYTKKAIEYAIDEIAYYAHSRY